MTAQTTNISSKILHVPNTASARAEVRQFLIALSGLAFVLSTFGTRDAGPMAFAADIVLVLCGAWCANQLIRGIETFKEQVICVLRAYFAGLLCCSAVLLVVGWLVFLPSEYLNLGRSLIFAATFMTNFELTLLPNVDGLRFDGLLNHLWVPALIAQCCVVLAALFWLFHKNITVLLLALFGLAVASLSLSTSNSAIVQMLPIGGLWAFLCGAIPFFATKQYPILRYALLLGIINLLVGVLALTATGDSLFARIFFALGVSFLYLGSRPRSSKTGETVSRRRWFGMALHLFLWAVPLAQVTAALDMMDPSKPNYTALMVPCLLLAILSWSLWLRIEKSEMASRISPTAIVASILLANGFISLSVTNVQQRFSANANAYVHAIETTKHRPSCPIQNNGPLAGLAVCKVGPIGQPTVLVWGDHQLTALRDGYEQAARRTGVSTLLVAHPNCIPLDGLQTRFKNAEKNTGRNCDRHSAQVLQAIPHIPSIQQVTLVADWLSYVGDTRSEFKPKPAVRLGPVDGTPIDMSMQSEYVAAAVKRTVDLLADQHLRVSVLRQVPAHPKFDAEIAARASAPGHWLYHSVPTLKDTVSMVSATDRHAPVDDLFRRYSITGKITYTDTWPAFCSSTRCDVRGGLSSDYVSSTELTSSGALSLCPILSKDLKRALTHKVQRRAIES